VVFLSKILANSWYLSYFIRYMIKIKQTILALLITMFIGGGLFILNAPVASAESCGGVTLKDGQSCCGGVVTSIIKCEAVAESGHWEGVCSDDTTPNLVVKEESSSYGLCADGIEKVTYIEPNVTNVSQTGLWQLLLLAINILTAGIGIAAVGGLIYGSILYTSSGAGSDGIKKAKEIIIGVVIGIIAYVLMYSFMNFIIPGGIFT